ncbi:MAG: hypothetical protein AAB377_00975 [Patescibacteria group bacterium]
MKKAALVLVCLAIAALFLVFAKNAYPVPGGDSEFFLVPALQFSNEGILTNPLFSDEQSIDSIDPSGMKRFLIYPPLFPLILNHGMTGAAPLDIFLTIAILNILVIWLSAWIFFRATKKDGELGWSKVFAVILGLLALASGLVGGSGRPEILGSLWAVLGILAYFYAGKKYDWSLYGILLGLMLATHLVGGIIALLVLGTVFAARHKPKEFFGRIFGALILGILTLFLTIKLGPFGIWETLSGTVKNALAVSAGYTAQLSEWFTLSKFIQYYFLSPVTPFYAFVVILLLVSGWFFYKKYRPQISSPRLFALCAVGLLIMLASMIYSVGHIFYLLIFAPIIFLGFLCYFSEAGNFSKMAVFMTLALVSTAFLRTIILFPSFLKEEPTFAQVREVFAKKSGEHKNDNLKFGVTGSFWSLSEDYGRMYVYPWPEKPKENTAFIFFQQKYSGMIFPPEISGCDISDDKFSGEAPKFLGIKLGNTAPGYNYAVYKCAIDEDIKR